ncbi:bifunctional DNA-binding transcriptional regulator/antitoxin component of YhaV-PrlF toxin-antitoxin module [Kutzneria viridogrisea]|uniref:Bifunctional DNA-binding transcriptional regulator/antitoxin component of YhaV-PrlF toxin-antitoxin module n=1 Tax=Kutzneria viridogrisea TaxID=47990 RepID=A0ABR6BY51_9PSEU|nr:bifunctional DNA-binding transcriptional regulator/antitoxin component of YhaV-PrlF toxin-antitoxin module [Kutzneria viridogrisea]
MPLPLPERLSANCGDSSFVYAVARLDDSGRVSDRHIAHAVGWAPGDRLEFHVIAGVVIIRPHPGGLFTRSTRNTLTIPASVRTQCRMRIGDQVLLAAAPEHHTVVIQNARALDQMILAFWRDPVGLIQLE